MTAYAPPLSVDIDFDARIEPFQFTAELDAKKIIEAWHEAEQHRQAERQYAAMMEEFADLIDFLDALIFIGV